MNQSVKQVTLNTWQPSQQTVEPLALTDHLEANQLICFPNLSFDLQACEQHLLTDRILSGKRKNISFDKYSQKLGGLNDQFDRILTTTMMRRFARVSEHLLHTLLPEYRDKLIPGRTSFRPAEVDGRQPSSYRSDDTLLHIDAFPSTPMQHLRILRFFANVNPNGKPRTWRVGEPFENLAEHFADRMSAPFPGSSRCLQLLHITRKYRTRYDHYMLQLHDKMKADQQYQETVDQTTIDLPANSCWMVFTDSVSHAAMAGQFCFEQTFYLPVDAMKDSKRSPQHVLQQQFGEALLA